MTSNLGGRLIAGGVMALVSGTTRHAVKQFHQRLIVRAGPVVESHRDPLYDRQLYLDARVRSIGCDGGADDAGARHGSGVETRRRDCEAARLAHPVPSSGHPHSRILDVVEVT